jgi:hypothetical protein
LDISSGNIVDLLITTNFFENKINPSSSCFQNFKVVDSQIMYKGAFLFLDIFCGTPHRPVAGRTRN